LSHPSQETVRGPRPLAVRLRLTRTVPGGYAIDSSRSLHEGRSRRVPMWRDEAARVAVVWARDSVPGREAHNAESDVTSRGRAGRHSVPPTGRYTRQQFKQTTRRGCRWRRLARRGLPMRRRGGSFCWPLSGAVCWVAPRLTGADRQVRTIVRLDHAGWARRVGLAVIQVRPDLR
jgi:hypothetical protein